MCLSGIGLYCDTTSSTCQCSSIYSYWASSFCRKLFFTNLKYLKKLRNRPVLKEPYQTYGQTCSSILCNPYAGLICPSTATGCSCPTTLSASYCDCPATQYWDTAALLCVNRVSYSVSCPTGQNYNCISGLNLICSGGVCTCLNSNYSWVGGTCGRLSF